MTTPRGLDPLWMLPMNPQHTCAPSHELDYPCLQGRSEALALGWGREQMPGREPSSHSMSPGTFPGGSPDQTTALRGQLVWSLLVPLGVSVPAVRSVRLSKCPQEPPNPDRADSHAFGQTPLTFRVFRGYS